MPTLESLLQQEPPILLESPKWSWDPLLMSMNYLHVQLVGPGPIRSVWVGTFRYRGGLESLDYVEADSKANCLQELEKKLLKRFPEFRSMLYHSHAKSALVRICGEEDLF